MKDIIKRLAVSFAAFLMWIVFTIGVLLALPLLPVAICIYAVTGNEGMRDFTYRVGKAIDQVCNAAWFFKGHPKETVSSHCGRIILKYGEDAPIKAKVVFWITNLFKRNHVLDSIEEPFKDLPTGVETW
jgi:hypothetical protein